jgi:hypothetical protein
MARRTVGRLTVDGVPLMAHYRPDATSFSTKRSKWAVRLTWRVGILVSP